MVLDRVDTTNVGRLLSASDTADLAAAVDVAVGAVERYVLARWASAVPRASWSPGRPSSDRRWATFVEAEAAGDDEARLAAYAELRQMVAWLRLPLEGEAGYGV